ncbi:MAG: hypothetical protein Q7R96_01910 [Nanoarchaeota archaeon]|nr:hypothetical protein [Nanoarchaeota archaeon]
MAKLFTPRRYITLVPTQGRVEKFCVVPGYLDQPMQASEISVSPKFGQILFDKFIGKDEGVFPYPVVRYVICPNEETGEHNVESVSGLWSGRRSALVLDQQVNYASIGEAVKIESSLFRLKGIALRDRLRTSAFEDGALRVWGGEFLDNVRYEVDYQQRFNARLEQEGIAATIIPAAIYQFQRKTKGRQLGAAVMQVPGDTRLDELLYLIESTFTIWVNESERKTATKAQDKFGKDCLVLYEEIGKIVGGLKSVLESAGLSWSDNEHRSNAHIGNIVIYQGQNNFIDAALVDLDACAEREDLSPGELEYMHRRDMQFLADSVYVNYPYSNSMGSKQEFCFPAWRNRLRRGIEDGYESGGNAARTSITEDFFEQITGPVREVRQRYFERLAEKHRKTIANARMENNLAYIDKIVKGGV